MHPQVNFIYNDPDFLGQTIFVKRGEHQGKLGIVKRVLADDTFEVAGGDFGDQVITFKRKEFLVYRYRKLKMRADKLRQKTG